MTIRYAILAGVSTEKQATPDKLSIPEQLKFVREKMHGQGIETAGPYIMDGYSRSGYDSLEVAMQEIPPLHDAIQAATADQYDILVMDNFDRLGDLGFIVMTRFKKLRRQLYSVRQSARLVQPSEYDPYTSESDETQMHVEGIIQAYRINKLRRAWRTGVPERARKGLHPLTIPYGYRLTGKDQPVTANPTELKLVRQMIDAYLQGTPLQGIVDLANASGIQPRRSASWQIAVIKRIIHNPFYAGIVQFGKFKTVLGKRVPLPPSEWVTSRGQHEPLIDEATHHAILAETERRNGQRSRAQNYALTGLLSCAICHSHLHRHNRVHRTYPVDLSCPNGHVHIHYALALKLVAHDIIKGIQLAAQQPSETPEHASERFLRAKKGILAERAEIQAGYEAKIYTLTEAHQKIVAIETKLEQLTRQHEHATLHAQQRQLLLQLADQDLADIRAWILTDTPGEVNHLLTALCETITITPRYELQITWR